MMRILVTGGTGQLAEALRAFGPDFEMICLSRRAGDQGCHHWDQQAGRVHPEPDGPIDALLHLAGATPTGCQDFEGTLPLAEQMLELARNYDIPSVICASSIAVYGPPLAAPFTEDSPCAPQHPYGISKRVLEQALVQTAAAYGVTRTCALRMGNLIGGDQLGRLAKDATPDAPLRLCQFPDGSFAQRSYVDARLVAGVVAALLETDIWPQMLNVAAIAPVGMDDVATRLGAAWGPVPATPKDVPLVAMNCSVFGKLVTPEVDLDPSKLAPLG